MEVTSNQKHLLIYDRLWWIQGQRALILQKYHPDLQIMSYRDLMTVIKQQGITQINKQHTVVATLGLWTAERFIQQGLHVHSSVIGSYSYVAKNQDYFREWSTEMRPNYPYMKQVIQQIDRIGAVNRKLATTINKYCPDKEVHYIKPFVNTDTFKPIEATKQNNHSIFTIGWVGNSEKRSKNYHTIYQSIKHYFKNDPTVQFKEATKNTRISVKDMPNFYRSLDLLLVTGVNEGIPNPGLEAYACGVPVLGTNIGIMKECASPNAKHLLLNTTNPRDFINKINTLKSNPKNLQVLKNDIRQNIVEHWSIKHHINDWLHILFNIAGDN